MFKRYMFLLVLACWSPDLLCDDLLDAVNAGDEKKVAQLLAKNPKLSFDPLYSAVVRGRKKIVAMLLAKDAPIDERALTKAAKEGHKEIVEMLLDKDAPIKDALNEAANNGHIEIVKMLLARGEPFGDVVMWAAAGGHREIVKMLLDKGAPFGDFSVSWAIEGDHRSYGRRARMVELLLAKGAKIDKYAMENALGDKNFDIVRMLVLFFSKAEIIKTKIPFTSLHELDIRTMPEIDEPTRFFFKWFAAGAKLDDLSKKDALRFAAVAFQMPACVDEFGQLLEFFTKPQDFKVFTSEVIKNALMMRNIEAFKLLLPKIAHTRDLMSIIRSELNNSMYQQEFMDELRIVMKQESAKPQLYKMGKGDVVCSFK